MDRLGEDHKGLASKAYYGGRVEITESFPSRRRVVMAYMTWVIIFILGSTSTILAVHRQWGWLIVCTSVFYNCIAFGFLGRDVFALHERYRRRPKIVYYDLNSKYPEMKK